MDNKRNSSGVIAIVDENNMITLDIFEYYRRLGVILTFGDHRFTKSH